MSEEATGQRPDDETAGPEADPRVEAGVDQRVEPGVEPAGDEEIDPAVDEEVDPGAAAGDTLVDEALDALADVKQRLAEVPVEVVVVNHVMGLYELAAIHLGAEPPRLAEAALAIDAVGCLVEGLGPRLGPDAGSLADALSNIRLAFVQIKKVATTAPS